MSEEIKKLEEIQADKYIAENFTSCINPEEALAIRSVRKAFIKGFQKAQEWISVEDKPLVIMDEETETWTVTENGDKEFIALAWVKNINTGAVTPWIHHCVIEDEIGLCIVGEVANDPADIDPWDIEHYFVIPNFLEITFN